MHFLSLISAMALVSALAAAEQPQTSLRGSVNGVTSQTAPATVAQGGILAVVGEELAAELAQAEQLPLPFSLGSPAVEVLVNDVPAALYFVSPTRVLAQVPWEIEPGQAVVVLKRGGAASAPMPMVVAESNPNLFTHADSSSLIVTNGGQEAAMAILGAAAPSLYSADGPASAIAAGGAGQIAPPAASISAGQTLIAFAAGLGATAPAGANGSGGAGQVPVLPQRAYLGGIPVSVSASQLAPQLAGVYQLSFEVPQMELASGIFHWVAGSSRGGAMLGSDGGQVTERYMSVPATVEAVARIDMTDLNPYFLAVSGPLDEVEFCYRDVQLLDYRNDRTIGLSECLVPSYPHAPNPMQFRPFELALNSHRIAALAEPAGDVGAGVTDRLVLIDSSNGNVKTEDLPHAVDRLQSGAGAMRDLRLLRAGNAGLADAYDPDTGAFTEIQGVAALPAPLEVDGLTRVVAQGASFGSGYRMRFLATEADASSAQGASAAAVLFDRRAQVVAKTPFPDGWTPISPPRRVNNQGVAVGNSLAPTGQGFAGDSAAYVVARSTDGARDAVVAFRAELPEDTDSNLPASIPVTAQVVAFPSGSYAANCTNVVRWQRLALTRRLALVATGEARSEFADPRFGEICGGDRLLLFDPETEAITPVDAPGPLDNSAKGSLRDYLYFGDGGRAVPLEAPRMLRVFDGGTDTFSEIDFPGQIGITLNTTNQLLPGQARLVALATGGPPRTNAAGNQLPPFAGNRGLLVVDFRAGTATRLALPAGLPRILPGNFQLVQQNRPGYGIIPILNRAFARAMLPNEGPGNPGGTRMVTWDLETGQGAQVPMPEGGFAVVQRTGRGVRPQIWDFKAKSASFAFGVFNRGGDVISIGVVGP